MRASEFSEKTENRIKQEWERGMQTKKHHQTVDLITETCDL